MNLSLLDEKILQLINQFSINGSLTPSENNLDYLLKTRNLIDACQKELAGIRKIPATFHIVLDQIATHNLSVDHPDYNLYTEIVLPIDFKELKDISVENTFYTPVNDYKFEGKTLLVKSNLVGSLTVNYYKKPTTITKDTINTTELEIDVDVQELIAYYVGGWIYLEDNPTIATMLLNEYKEKRDKIYDILPQTPIQIENMFQGFM